MNENDIGSQTSNQQLPESLKQQFQQAVELAQRRKLPQALTGFETCLKIARREQIPLAIEQLASIMLEQLFCYGDMGDWSSAFTLAAKLEHILQQKPGWQAAIPEGIQMAPEVGYDPLPHLAALYEALGIASSHTDNNKAAQQYYQRAIQTYLELGNRSKAATVWQHVAITCQKNQDWRGLHSAAQQMLALWTQESGAYGQVWAWQYLAQAAAQQGHLPEAVTAMEEAVKLERSLQHRDLARDEKLLAELKQAFGRTLPGIKERIVRGLFRK